MTSTFFKLLPSQKGEVGEREERGRQRERWRDEKGRGREGDGGRGRETAITSGSPKPDSKPDK